MAKKYSSLTSLASSSTTPYGKRDTSTPSTFNLPNLVNKASRPQGGVTISDYTNTTSTSLMAGTDCAPKHIQITAGEYVLGSFNIGNQTAGQFRQSDDWPVAIHVNRYVYEDVSLVVDLNYTQVTNIQDLGGYYMSATGVQLNSSTAAVAPTLLQGSDVLPTAGAFVLVYDSDKIPRHGMMRQIKVFFSDATNQTFDVLLPGSIHTMGLGDSLATILGPNNPPDNFTEAYNCSSINNAASTPHYTTSIVNSHGANYINGLNQPYFVGLNSPGNNATGLMNMNVTGLGAHHDNSGLWTEGFQPDDGGSFSTNAHQETWPLGLFYFSESNIGNLSETLLFNTHTNYNFASNGDGAPGGFWARQYNGSNLTNLSHPTNDVGHPLKANSIQHYTWIQSYITNDAGWNSGYNTHVQSTQANYANNTTTTSGATLTADDGGSWYNTIESEILNGTGSVFHNSTAAYLGSSGGWTGLIANPTANGHTPVFQSIQIYTEMLECACTTVTPTTISIDLCTDSNSASYYLYSGVDCTGAAVPANLMNGTALLGQFGCTNCDYELVASGTSACPSCHCGSDPPPDISLTNITPPTIQGGNDASADIEINPANAGTGPWVYLVEPLANTSAGLGIGAIDTCIIQTPGVHTMNGIFNTTQTNTTGSGTGAKVTIQVVGNVATVIDSIDSRGINHAVNDFITFNGPSGSFAARVTSVKGVTVSIHGTGTSNGNNTWFENPHEDATGGADATFSNGLKATIGTGIVLAHRGGAAATNNYGKNPYFSSSSVVNNIPGVPFNRCDFFDNLANDTSNSTGTAITGLEAGSYTVTVIENVLADSGTWGCFSQSSLVIPPGVNSTNGCTDNNTGTNDGAALNYDPAANVDDGSCIYCRAVDGKLVDSTSTELSVAGSNNPGDILTSTNNSTAVAATTSVATDGSISYTRTLNSIMSFYASQIVNAAGTANAEFKMELYKRTNSTQTLTGASQVGATVTTATNIGFNFDFDSTNWSQGLTYGYYAVKSYVDDPDSASEQEQCFQVDYFIVPVLACITGQPGMQVGITTDSVTITDLDLVVSSIPGNNLNPCTTQCCDDPTAIVGYAQNSSIPGCADPYFQIDQTCPAGNNQHITVITSEIQKLINNVWTTVLSDVDPTPGPFASNTNLGTTTHVITVYQTFGPGDYRVNRILEYTWPNGTTSQCDAATNIIALNSSVCGCTDPNSLNFNPLATIDDGSCTYCVDGCMDPNALNYNSLATCPEPCIYCIYGCMDPAATNYNSAATCDDGSCNYGVACGCTDILASNYGYDWNGNLVGLPPPCDDGSCIYGGLFCKNPPTIQYDTIEATCLPQCNIAAVLGCMDPTASNYNPNAYAPDPNAPCLYCSGTANISDPALEEFLETRSYLTTSSGTVGNVNQPVSVGAAGAMGNGTIGDGLVDKVNICSVTYLNIDGLYGRQLGNPLPLSDLDGIKHFKALTTLLVGRHNNAYSPNSNLVGNANLDVSGLTDLLTLYINFNNGMTSLDVTNNLKLTTLALNHTNLSFIDVTNNVDLLIFYLGSTPFTVAPDLSLNINLQVLDIGSTNISSLDISNNTALKTLRAPYCPSLNYIDISTNTDLEIFDFVATGLISFDFSTNTKLKQLLTTGGTASSIDLSTNTALNKLEIQYYANLTTLDLSVNTNLNFLWINDNNLSLIDLGDGTTGVNLASIAGGFGGAHFHGNASNLVIKVGTATRVTQAQSFVQAGTFIISPGTTFQP